MKLSKTAEGLSSQLAPVLEGCLGAIYRVTDAHKARQINNHLKMMVRLAIKAKEAGLTNEQFMGFLDAVSTEQATVAGGRIEFAAAVSSGLETAEGKEFNVGLSAGGSIAGFGVEVEGGYSSDSRSSSYERSSQNLRIRIDFASAPMDKFDAMVDSIASRVFAEGTEAPMPDMSDEEASPILEALESYLPVIKAVLAKDEE